MAIYRLEVMRRGIIVVDGVDSVPVCCHKLFF